MNLLQRIVSTQKVPMIKYNGFLKFLQKKFVQEAKIFRSKEQKDKIKNFFKTSWEVSSEPSNVRLKT